MADTGFISDQNAVGIAQALNYVAAGTVHVTIRRP